MTNEEVDQAGINRRRRAEVRRRESVKRAPRKEPLIMAPDRDDEQMYVNSRGGSRPVPDPTVLTTQALAQAISSLKELFETRISALEKNMELLQQGLDERSKEVRETVKHLERLHDEKFCRIQTQISERDIQTEKASRDVKAAVDAAFAAAKEAVGEQNKSNALAIGKSEATTTKQLDGITDQIKTNTKTTDEKIADIKDRLTIIESIPKGIASTKLEATQNWGFVVGAIGMISGLVIGTAAIITIVMRVVQAH